MQTIDLKNWKRREYYEFYSQFEDPFFGIMSEIDCTLAYNYSRKENISFFANYLHKSLVAVNKIKEFKYRILEDNVVLFDKIHCASTIGRKDNSFAFSFAPFEENFINFNNNLQKEIDNVENSTGLRLNNDGFRKDVIYFSTIPWIKFTGIKHPVNMKVKDSVPKITFGKAFPRDKRWILPVSVDIHHGFADGYHVAEYFNIFQNLMNQNN